MPKIACNYAAHFTEITQKYREMIEFRGKCLSDLIAYLDTKYKGLKEEVIDSTTGGLATRNLIYIEREEENTNALLSLDAEIRDGDILTFF